MDLDELKNKAKDFAGQHSDQVNQGIDKAREFVDDKTGNKHSDQIQQGVDKAKDGLRNVLDLDGLDERIYEADLGTLAQLNEVLGPDLAGPVGLRDALVAVGVVDRGDGEDQVLEQGRVRPGEGLAEELADLDVPDEER